MTVIAILLSAVYGWESSKQRYTPDWNSLDNRPLPPWFDQAKFGIFIHWGVFSVPSYKSEWYWRYLADGKKDFVHFHESNYGKGFAYQDFAPMFQAKLFDPDHWASVFKKSGARYVVLTSKHHEGFTLWPSNASWNWNAKDIGPHRDLVGDLAQSVRKQGLHFGLYHSLFEWFNPMYLEDQKNNFTTRKFVTQKTMVELREIVEQYHPEIIWSDGDWDASSDYWQSREFLAWLYNDSPVKDTVVVNDRWGKGCARKHGGFYNGADRQQPEPELLKHKWENAMTVDRGTWGYSRVSPLSHYLDAQEIVKELVSSVAYNGNLILNVGPTSDGILAPIFEERLTQIGKYLSLNGDAIYGTNPYPYRQNATLDEKNRDNTTIEAYFTAKSNGTVLYYLTVGLPDCAGPWVDFHIPLNPEEIDVFNNKLARVLVHGGKQGVDCERGKASVPTLHCKFNSALLRSAKGLDPHGFVVRLEKQKSRIKASTVGSQKSIVA